MNETPTPADPHFLPAPSLTVVAITGAARSGKDTAAGILVTSHGFHRVSLADGVRSAFSDLSGPTWELHKELRDETVNFRRAMQLLGTEARVESGCPRLWVDLFLVKIRYTHAHHPVSRSKFVIADMRFPYEREWIREKVVDSWGGRFECWRITRPEGGTILESAHASEQMLDQIPADRELINGGTLSEYVRIVLETASIAMEGLNARAY